MSEQEVINLIEETKSKINNIDFLKTIEKVNESDFILYHVLSLNEDDKEEYDLGIENPNLDIINEKLNSEGIYISFVYAQENGYVYEYYDDEPDEYPQFAKYKDDEHYENLNTYEIQCCGEYDDIVALDDVSVYETSDFGIAIKKEGSNLDLSFKFHEGGYCVNYTDLDTSVQLHQEVIKIICENIIYKE